MNTRELENELYNLNRELNYESNQSKRDELNNRICALESKIELSKRLRDKNINLPFAGEPPPYTAPPSYNDSISPSAPPVVTATNWTPEAPPDVTATGDSSSSSSSSGSSSSSSSSNSSSSTSSSSSSMTAGTPQTRAVPQQQTHIPVSNTEYTPSSSTTQCCLLRNRKVGGFFVFIICLGAGLGIKNAIESNDDHDDDGYDDDHEFGYFDAQGPCETYHHSHDYGMD